MDAVGRQALPQGGGMTGLGAGPSAGRLLDHRRRGRGRVGRGGQGGIGAVEAQAGLQVAHGRLQLGDVAVATPDSPGIPALPYL